ncbi:hypothetical protein PTHTG4_27840 [Parageobacillus thermoglucosidasius]|nr:hypothetical protein PTHTG4_27840 [Parageobacillus thermoglucosidasius]
MIKIFLERDAIAEIVQAGRMERQRSFNAHGDQRARMREKVARDRTAVRYGLKEAVLPSLHEEFRHP